MSNENTTFMQDNRVLADTSAIKFELSYTQTLLRVALPRSIKTSAKFYSEPTLGGTAGQSEEKIPPSLVRLQGNFSLPTHKLILVGSKLANSKVAKVEPCKFFYSNPILNCAHN